MAGRITHEEDEERRLTDQLAAHMLAQADIGHELIGRELTVIETGANIPLFGQGDLKGTSLTLTFGDKKLVIEGQFTSVRIDG